MTKKDINPIEKHVGNRMRMRRMMLNMSQTKLGDALGLTFQQVQKYEKGTNRIGAGRLWLIAQLLSVPVEFFFVGLEGGAQADSTNGEDLSQTFFASREGFALASAFSKIKEGNVRRSIVQMAETLAE